MKRIYLVIATAISMVPVFMSCEKDAISTTDDTMKNSLTEKKWRIAERLKEYYVNGILNPNQPYSGNIVLTTEADNVYTFTSNNQVELNQGTLWEPNTTTQILNGTWQFTQLNNIKYLRIIGSQLALNPLSPTPYNDFEILQLNSNTMQLMLKIEFTIGDGVTIPFQTITQKEFITYL